MSFSRLRRLRKNKPIRDMVSETQICAKNLIMPYFVIEGTNKKKAIDSMPGIYRLSIDNLVADVKEAKKSGINAILLFGLANRKDEIASESYKKNGVLQRAVRTIKKNINDIAVISDVCLCGYTLSGHCGIITPQKRKKSVKAQNFIIDNDETIKVLAKIALSHAQAGADFVAPSAMMDGQVKAIRETLDKNGFFDVGILAYCAKYASNFYGPFRDALGSQPKFGDRKSYQMDYRNSDQALREIEEDIQEGADIVMVKPALAYLDIIQRAKQNFNVPIAAYNVSGEYSLVKAYYGASSIEHRASELEKNLVLEILTSIKRAGADLIISYHAKEVAQWLRI